MNAEPPQTQRCAECAFWQKELENDGICRRHAPEASHLAEEVSHWPQTRAEQGCGEGQARGDTEAIECQDCAFWRRYRGGLHPMNRSDMPNSWWARAGVCARYAPRPLGEPGPRAFWRATSETDCCGEGIRK